MRAGTHSSLQDSNGNPLVIFNSACPGAARKVSGDVRQQYARQVDMKSDGGIL
jgi:hypothetical protein